MRLSFTDELQRDFPDEFRIADNAARQVMACIDGKDYSALEAHSPGLKGFNWANYINLSSIRMVRALRLLRRHASPGAKVLDFGAYFGNCALMLAQAGYQVTALDSYDSYGACFDDNKRLLAEHGVTVRNFTDFEPSGDHDAVMLMGVIEHVPHTPRLLLRDVHRALVPEGLMVLDTPNLAYIYNRQKLSRGQSIHPPIQSQFATQLPFEGHHREYTASEIEWMLEASSFATLESEAFNYSLYGLTELAGIDFENHQEMQADPSLRELLIYAARAVVPKVSAARASHAD
ncbi:MULTISPECIES: class I SAM-dependent methyltransferase [unclassified Pseudomonas]|uniref:class I SAM-dependent methyltransferase n=1 Tax=unclassified Pseudomonas TaxID=196821 RepID=UPI000DA6E96D|nr:MULTISPECIES: class I SAM-dependent methyltransferase [unclassified Pseudomonas]MDW3713326.1 class I SAM-dependent methyltransferase [Pseudomonas sp. 2023EL-01195]PZE12571.1 methyltransferase type 11 [Pseudomonas sp. 57B-090624]